MPSPYRHVRYPIWHRRSYVRRNTRGCFVLLLAVAAAAFGGTLSVTMVGNRERVRDRYEFTFFFWPNRSFGSS